MEKQLIISIGREYGSRGHQIGELLAKKLDIYLYDRNLLDEVAKENGVSAADLSYYDEQPKKKVFSRTVRGYSNSNAQNIAELQHALLKSRAADGDSFIVIGRCSDEIFEGLANTVSIFITVDHEDAVKRIMEHRNFSRKEAEKAIQRHNKHRANYHDYFCKTKWGIAESYDLTVNMSKLGVERTVDFIYQWINEFVMPNLK